LSGKYVGIYFSAHWCPPCRGFTPMLAAAYSNHLKAKDLEVIFVSSDRDEDAFKEYFGEMPWAALPYADREANDKLNKKFKVQGIPTFVLLNKDGSIISDNARGKVQSDPEGTNFPWIPKPLSQLLDTELAAPSTGGATHFTDLEGKVVGLYFSAHWCPPCRGYTPQLCKKYEELKAAGLPFEVVFCSSDRDEDAFKEYHAEMPWPALPYADRSRKEELSDRFGVAGIPTLVLLDKDRSVITTNGRGAVMGPLSDFPFFPKPVGTLADPEGIDEAPSVVVFAETQSPAEQDAAYAALEPIAKEVNAKAKETGDDPEFKFFLARGSEGAAGQIRRLAKLPSCVAPHEHPLERNTNMQGWGCDGCGKGGHECQERYRCTQGCDFDYCGECNKMAETAAALPMAVVLLDIPDNGGYYTPVCEITTAGIRQLLDDYRAKKLERQQMEG